MTRLIVIRHGFSQNNAVRRFTGQADVPLSDIGREQALCVADYLTKNEQIDAIYASDLSRAVDTVAPTAGRLGLSVIPEPALWETDVERICAASSAEIPYSAIALNRATC